MDTLSALDPLAWQPEYLPLHPAYQAGNALGWLSLENKQASTNYPLAGRLYVSKSGWLMLSVPNALVRGVYDALVAPGAELPGQERSDVLNAHISVMTAAEVSKLSPNTINERGHNFHYTLGALREIPINKAGNLSRVWAIQISSPQLSEIRKSYGLSPLPKDEPFHITVACRRKGVLLNNGTSKGDGEAAVTETSRGELKAAAELPWRDRVEVFTKHPQTGKIYGGTWDNDKSFAAPGGGIDPGETPEQAAVRELAEETGIQAANPVLLPIAPVNNPWSDEYRARTGRNFAGSRTHFVMADFVNKLKRKNLDFWAAGNRRFYKPEHALELMQNKTLPSVGAARMQALQHIIDSAAKKQAAAELSRAGQKDLLSGGEADNVPDREFPPAALAEGAQHEHEHTNDDQVAKEIAKDHLSEDPRYYKKVREIEKPARPRIIEELLAAKNHSDNKRYGHKSQILRKLMEQSPQDWVIDDSAPKFQGITHTPTKFRFHTDRTAIPTGVKAANTGSVYGNQLTNMMSLRQPISYDHTKPVFENLTNNLSDVKRRGDFMLQAKRNNQQYRAAIDPKYRYQLAMQAFNGQMDQPAVVDQIIEQQGDRLLNMTGVPH